MTFSEPGVAVSSPVPGIPSGSVIVVEAVASPRPGLLVVWVPWTVFVPAITVWTLVIGMLFTPVVRTPAL